uniref:Uncharacterized protein n=1 Tax=Panagrolaimus davidi TaxID=227884 RepID=A0A914PRR9_9BILA
MATDSTPVTEIKNKHNHAGDALASERRIVRNAAHRIVAENPSSPLRQIVARATSAVSDSLRIFGLGENLDYETSCDYSIQRLFYG